MKNNYLAVGHIMRNEKAKEKKKWAFIILKIKQFKIILPGLNLFFFVKGIIFFSSLLLVNVYTFIFVEQCNQEREEGVVFLKTKDYNWHRVFPVEVCICINKCICVNSIKIQEGHPSVSTTFGHEWVKKP